ncbi:MAG TPA: tetratricopeptide repeat protein, partial [Blastocatellia bacterium]|nr:tetratricopeptide repeat protein [Blastocatellia bacterium]
MLNNNWWVHLVYIVCLATACTIGPPRYEYMVEGKVVAEDFYRAVRFYNDGIPLINANRLAEARVKLTAAVRLAPDFYDAHYHLGLVLLQLGRERDALEHFKAVVNAKADVPLAWSSLGEIYVNAGQYNEAINTFNDAASRFPPTSLQKVPELYFNFATALARVGRTDEAIEK